MTTLGEITTVPEPVASPERRRFRPHKLYGVTLFSAGPDTWDPARPHPTGDYLRQTIAKRPSVEVDAQWFLVDALSNVQRGIRQPTHEEITAWIQTQVVPVFQQLHAADNENARQLKRVMQDNFGININREPGRFSRQDNEEYFAKEGRKWWKKYFEDGSKTGLFISDLTKDLRRDSKDISSRLRLAEPFLYLFGGEETAIFMNDAARAQYYMGHAKDLLVGVAQTMGNGYFTSPAQERAYEVAWDLYRRGAMSPERNRRAEAVLTRVEEGAPLPPQGMRQQMPAPSSARAPVAPATPLVAAPQPTRVEPQPRPIAPAPEAPQPSPQPIRPQPPPGGAPRAPQPLPQPAVEQPHPLPITPPAQPVATEAAVPSGAEEKKEAKKTPEFVLASKVIASPEHPSWTADRAVAMPLQGGGFLLAAIDGMGMGQQYSEVPAEYIQQALHDWGGRLMKMPTRDEGRKVLMEAFSEAAAKADLYRGYIAEKDDPKADVLNNIGAVASASILCERDDSTYSLLTFNLGDARTLLYSPDDNTLQHVTTDHSLVQQLVRQGSLTPDEAFLSPNRNVVNKSVTLSNIGRVQAKLNMGKEADEISEVVIPKGKKLFVISWTDGFVDNIPPDFEKEDLQNAYGEANRSGTVSPSNFIDALLKTVSQRMHYGSVSGSEPIYKGQKYAKLDDAGIAVAYYSGD